MPTEQWRSIPGFPGYEVSDQGRVISHFRRPAQEIGGRVHQPDGYVRVGLMQDGRQRKVMLHRLVLLAFAGPCPRGLVTRHLDGNPLNNSLSNLAYGTARDNNLDTVRHGNNRNNQKIKCDYGHPFDESNTYTKPSGSRGCRTCRRVATRAWRRRVSASAAIEVSA